MNLTPHFTLEEFTRSDTANAAGIDNSASPMIVASLRELAAMLEQVRRILGSKPMLITSGYRCPELNAHPRIRGVPNSDHLLGRAADFVCPGFGSPTAICRAIHASDVPFDQLIDERNPNDVWVHISWSPAPRREAWRYRNGSYERGLP